MGMRGKVKGPSQWTQRDECLGVKGKTKGSWPKHNVMRSKEWKER